MPNSRSMHDFKKQVRRLRYHSQCADSEIRKISTGSSPGNCNSFTTVTFIMFSNSSSLGDSLPPNMTVRRANSWPEMRKTTGNVQHAKDNISKTLYETDEEGNVESRNGVIANRRAKQKILTCSETQTENFWPMPYEHLFLGIFPSLENQEVKPSPAPSPAPISTQQEKYCPPVSVNEILDKLVK